MSPAARGTASLAAKGHRRPHPQQLAKLRLDRIHDRPTLFRRCERTVRARLASAVAQARSGVESGQSGAVRSGYGQWTAQRSDRGSFAGWRRCRLHGACAWAHAPPLGWARSLAGPLRDPARRRIDRWSSVEGGSTWTGSNSHSGGPHGAVVAYSSSARFASARWRSGLRQSQLVPSAPWRSGVWRSGVRSSGGSRSRNSRCNGCTCASSRSTTSNDLPCKPEATSPPPKAGAPQGRLTLSSHAPRGSLVSGDVVDNPARPAAARRQANGHRSRPLARSSGPASGSR
jgi:hypothetical protein